MRKLVALLIAAAFVIVGCTSEEVRNTGQVAKDETNAINNGLHRMLDSQPVPVFDWSQERETLRDVLTIRGQGANTTSLFLLNGIGPVAWCPSVGSAIPETTQLTKSGTPAWFGERLGSYLVDQMEPTGVYPGQTEGTWTVCVDDSGKKFGVRWEAPVTTITGVVDVSVFGKDIPRIEPSEITYEFSEE